MAKFFSTSLSKCPHCLSKDGEDHLEGCPFRDVALDGSTDLSPSEILTRKVSENLSDLNVEARQWKRIAMYLASCHAATYEYDGNLKSCSKSRRERYRSLVQISLRLLEGREDPPNISYNYEFIVSRLKECLEGGK